MTNSKMHCIAFKISENNAVMLILKLIIFIFYVKLLKPVQKQLKLSVPSCLDSVLELTELDFGQLSGYTQLTKAEWRDMAKGIISELREACDEDTLGHMESLLVEKCADAIRTSLIRELDEVCDKLYLVFSRAS